MKKVCLITIGVILLMSFRLGVAHNYSSKSIETPLGPANIKIYNDIHRYPFVAISGGPFTINILVWSKKKVEHVEIAGVWLLNNDNKHQIQTENKYMKVSTAGTNQFSIYIENISLPKTDLILLYDVVVTTNEGQEELMLKFNLDYERNTDFGNHLYDHIMSI